MTKRPVSQMTDAGLVELFAECCIQQDIGLLGKGIAWFTRFFDRMHEADGELKRRDGDQRRQLLALFKHPNMQVRVQAAKVTLAVAPAEARRQLEDNRRETLECVCSASMTDSPHAIICGAKVGKSKCALV